MELLTAALLLTGTCRLEGPVVLPSAAEEARATARIQELILQLGAPAFRTREQASATLEQQGAAVLPALRRAGATSGDLEIRVRAERLIATLEERQRARRALLQILNHACQGKEPASEAQLIHAMHLLLLGRPATTEERQQGERQLQAAPLRVLALPDLIAHLEQQPDHNRRLLATRLRLMDLRQQLALDREALLQRLPGPESPLQSLAKSMLEVARPLDDRQAIELFFLVTIARLPTAKEYLQIEKHLKPPKPMERQGLLTDLWWALVNTTEFLHGPP